MPRYRLILTTFLQPNRTASASQYQAGTEIDFDGAPGPSLLPLDDEARGMMAIELSEKGLSGTHIEKVAWAKAINVAPTSITQAESAITAFIARHHPDPRTRERFGGPAS